MKQVLTKNKIAKAIRNVLIYGGPIAMLSVANQSAYAAENTDDSGEAPEVIQVTGNRATMNRSLNEKKNTIAVVDAIAAADFGDLPGLSLSDVIENIPGASGHREKGSQNEISLRGLGSFLGYATFNGRSITNAGPNRAVNFKKFPSELVDKVVIYKTQQADLVEGAVSGLIDVSSLKPVAYGKEQTIVEVTGVYNDGANNIKGESPYGKEFLFSTVNSFEVGEGDLGFSLGVTYSDSANPEEIYTTSSNLNLCGLRNADGTEIGGTVNCDSDPNRGGSAHSIHKTLDKAESTAAINQYDPTSLFMMPSSFAYRTIEDDDERKSIVSAIQYTPNEFWDFNADVVYSELEYLEQRHELALSDVRYGQTDHIMNDEHALVYFKGSSKAQLVGERRSQYDEYTGWGLKASYTPNADLKVDLDLSYSNSYRERIRHLARYETKNQQTFTWDRRDTLVPNLSFNDASGNAYWEAGFDSATAFDPSSLDSLDPTIDTIRYYRDLEERDDTIYAARLDLDYNVGGSFIDSVKFGVRYSEETMLVDEDAKWAKALVPTDTQPEEFKSTDSSAGLADDLEEALATDVKNNCLSEFNNKDYFGDVSGGNPVNGFLIMDAECGIAQIYDRDEADPTQRTFSDIGNLAERESPGDVDAQENILAAYAMANFRSELGSLPIEGNFGVRAVRTETTSLGWNNGLVLSRGEDGSYTVGVASEVDSTPIVTEADNLRFLPSANITFHLNQDLMLRLGAFRAMSRVALQDMSSGRVINFNNSDNEGQTVQNINEIPSLAGDIIGGNPYVAPMMSWNGDVSLEWYPSQDAYLSFAYYWKEFDAVFRSSKIYENFDVAIPDGTTATFSLPVLINDVEDKSSVIQGFELSAQKHFSELPAPFDGLGVKAAYNYSDSDYQREDPNFSGLLEPSNMWGNSKETASASVYWDFDKLSLRLLYKYRSKYYQPSNLFDTRSNRYVDDAEYFDFSGKYKINKVFSVSLKMLNLLNEPKVQVRGVDSSISEVSSTGTKVFLSVAAKF
ncbi:TonB-dependent receptor [Catenovulum maritimum]|uniref:Uncharacterized protein n=1 Tax=Catenovulum maritimum TaxID=1513271 RepID=A0A0J8GVE1_9ALTE|nr:TonB-dependent receptor [Catenovulum maritimum]KMT66707.1 hypothetical protein XM47_00825 [Catenovulum maritimum]